MRSMLPLLITLTLLTVTTAWRIPAPAPAPARPEAVEQLTAAATTAPGPSPPDAAAPVMLHDHSLTLARAARQRLERRDRAYRDDCSGYVASVLDEAGLLDALAVEPAARVIDFWNEAEARGALYHHPRPAVGDLAFFDNTWDRDGDGAMDDLRTHIAVVVDVEPDGTIVLAHRGSTARLIRMNLLHPTERHGPDGVEWNSHLRRSGDRGNPLGLYLTAELWSGFASLAELEPG